MKTWFQINASTATPEVADISILDEIGFWGVNASRFLSEIKAIKAPVLRLLINSPGGSVIDALAIFNGLRNTGKRIEVKVLGVAASAGSYLAMAGDHVSMPENTFMFLHNPIGGVYGNADEMRETADVLDKFAASLTATYMRRWKGEPEALQKVLADETWLTAAECLEYGLCDEVVPAIEATAKFDLDRAMPDHVRAALTPKAPATPPTPTAPAALAEQIVAAAKQAGFEALGPVLAGSTEIQSMEAAEAAFANAREVRSLLTVLAMTDREPEVLKSLKPFADVRAQIAAERAEADEKTHTNSAPPPVKPTAAAAKPLSLVDIYNRYNHQTEKSQ